MYVWLGSSEAGNSTTFLGHLPIIVCEWVCLNSVWGESIEWGWSPSITQMHTSIIQTCWGTMQWPCIGSPPPPPSRVHRSCSQGRCSSLLSSSSAGSSLQLPLLQTIAWTWCLASCWHFHTTFLCLQGCACTPTCLPPPCGCYYCLCLYVCVASAAGFYLFHSSPAATAASGRLQRRWENFSPGQQGMEGVDHPRESQRQRENVRCAVAYFIKKYLSKMSPWICVYTSTVFKVRKHFHIRDIYPF